MMCYDLLNLATCIYLGPIGLHNNHPDAGNDAWKECPRASNVVVQPYVERVYESAWNQP
jgi:hypothetical protein